jgi:hypothetical protein
MGEDGFTMVGRGRPRGLVSKSSLSGLASAALGAGEALAEPGEWARRRLPQVLARLAQGEGLALCDAVVAALRPLGPFSQVVCLGLGRLSTRSAELQVALALIVARAEGLLLPGPAKLVAFDPLFDAGDREALVAAGFAPLADNADGTAHAVGEAERALFFMPHCNASLYSNVLWANWAALDRAVFLGNAFRSYHQGRVPAGQAACLLRCAPLAREASLPLPRQAPDLERAFNDLCVLHFARPEQDAALAELAGEARPAADRGFRG